MSRVTPEATGPDAPPTANPPSSFADDQPDNACTAYYPVKWVLDEQDTSVPICMQGQNGPCALLALANATLQTNATRIAPGTTRIREDHLMALLADYVSSLSSSSPTLSSPTATHAASAEESASNAAREYAVADFLDLLPRLNRGMHVNIRFDAPTSFEFTRELSVFDVFPAIRLVHGWLVDPQDVRLTVALNPLSYNQLCDELVRTAEAAAPLASDGSDVAVEPSAPPPEAFDMPADGGAADDCGDGGDTAVTHSADDINAESPETATIREVRPLVVDFLESNSTQLTIYGLAELHATLRERETAILFRNCHFYVIRKHKGEMFTLVTDEGFLHELNTVWEKLADVTGDSSFYNGAFLPLSPSGAVLGTQDSARQDAARQGSARVVRDGGGSSRPTGLATSDSTGERRPVQEETKVRPGAAGAPSSSGAPSRKKKSGKSTCAMQ